MSWLEVGVLVVGVFGVIGLALQILLLVRGSAREELAAVNARLASLSAENERLEREMRDAFGVARREAHESARSQREEQTVIVTQLGQGLATHFEGLRGTVDQRLQAVVTDQRDGREETQNALKRFGDGLSERFVEVRSTLDKQLGDLAVESSKKLDEMRQTVDEKLHKTLEDRLATSFKTVSERLEQVHKGLGEMQTLAAGVGDLKRVLTNVKTRGTYGETQLGALLEQSLAQEQFVKDFAPRRGGRDRVDYAVRMPGRDVDGDACYLPIDAKFPQEDYQRLQDAVERADAAGVEECAKALELRIKEEARSIRDKYVNPPVTTDFALLFLPTEGLYAEVLRRPGTVELIQRDYRVIIVGPTTLMALLNSLQMGFRTLAIEKRSSEVWKTLGAVKAEFGKFADVLAATKSKLDEAAKKIGDAEHRTRQIQRKLRGVEALPGAEAQQLLGTDLSNESAGDGEDDELPPTVRRIGPQG